MRFSLFITCLFALQACAAAQSTTGLYAIGFEASILYPCDEQGAQWWLTPNTEFAEQYQTLWEPGEERAWLQGPYAFVRVNGELTGAGEYGHLGMFEREFTVTDVVDMRGIDGEPEGDVHEWVRRVCEEAGE